MLPQQILLGQIQSSVLWPVFMLYLHVGTRQPFQCPEAETGIFYDHWSISLKQNGQPAIESQLINIVASNHEGVLLYDRLTVWQTVWPTEWLYDRQYDHMTVWPTVWPCNLQYDNMTDSMTVDCQGQVFRTWRYGELRWYSNMALVCLKNWFKAWTSFYAWFNPNPNPGLTLTLTLYFEK